MVNKKAPVGAFYLTYVLFLLWMYGKGELMEIQTNNESKTAFNLNFDNGLPYKPVIRCETKVFHQKESENAAIIHLNILSGELDSVLNEFQCLRTVIDENEIYVDVGDYYIVGAHGSNLVVQSAREKTIAVKFYREGRFLFWIGFDD